MYYRNSSRACDVLGCILRSVSIIWYVIVFSPEYDDGESYRKYIPVVYKPDNCFDNIYTENAYII